jgi:N-acetyl-beta-hexosaminidase
MAFFDQPVAQKPCLAYAEIDKISHEISGLNFNAGFCRCRLRRRLAAKNVRALHVYWSGDEVPKETWKNCPQGQTRIKAEGLEDEEELQGYFERRIEKFVTAHGRKLIGWSEIVNGGLPPNSVVMDWIGGAAPAANSGHDVVLASEGYTY